MLIFYKGEVSDLKVQMKEHYTAMSELKKNHDELSSDVKTLQITSQADYRKKLISDVQSVAPMANDNKK